MKKRMTLMAVLSLTADVTACGGHGQSGDQPVCWDGCCKYHYALNTAQDLVDYAARDTQDAICG